MRRDELNDSSAAETIRVKLAETPGEWIGLVAVRLSVFCDEQGVPVTGELDEHDRSAVHAVAMIVGSDEVPAGVAVTRQGAALRASAQAGRYLPMSLAGARGGHKDDGRTAHAIGGARLVRRLEGVAQIGRVAVLPAWRGTGLGGRLMRLLEEVALARGSTRVMIHAQVQAKAFYDRLGYVVDGAGNIFLEDGIPHVRMMKPLSMDM
ncbi:MAG: GNAT family N-acetyltransferase [Proteobacteria bacterium]|jgi:predicted GNAT family N-acyltransferase|nr:GNAT family N-acetyltransferase [Pseudomonadota bacterium]NCV20637.1 GNAT family N-acetyltransferase [Chloroflexota bacterium]NBQ31874.1 GNAT family N-acetyltransferase [Pseudomonadota bacterium]NBQ61951.1 GNAT family N-acetyltransferase [Pseudomonadota bacterium]NBT03917.1 GNAT family N-acetyltransferase [Pseudomonadota bacterium]